jgi:hypothetical protein
MNISAHSVLVLNGKWPRSLIIRTTLYDLIAAINAEVGADEDDLVIALVVHLLKTHWLTYVGTVKPRRFSTDQSQIKKHVGVGQAEELWGRERRCQSKEVSKCPTQSEAAMGAHAEIS